MIDGVAKDASYASVSAITADHVAADLARPQAFDFTLAGEQTSESPRSCSITVSARPRSTLGGTEKLRVAIVETDVDLIALGIGASQNGQTNLYSLERDMLPDENGTAFSEGSASATLSYTAGEGVNYLNTQVIAWVQDDATKIVLDAWRLDGHPFQATALRGNARAATGELRMGALAGGKLSLNLPQSGVYALEIFALDGSLLSKCSLSLSAGEAVVASGMRAPGACVVRLSGQGGSLTKSLILGF